MSPQRSSPDATTDKPVQPASKSRDRRGSEHTAEEPRPWYKTRTGLGLISLFIALALGGVIASAFQNATLDLFGYVNLRMPTLTPSVPASVYFYSFLGALAYAFTSVVVPDEEKNRQEVLQVGLRVPAALLLAAGIYLLAGLAIPADPGPNENVMAGVAFLVGLYINVALKALGALADRLIRSDISLPEAKDVEPSDETR